MIRFCDNSVGCIEYGLLNKNELLAYFSLGHLDETVCVYNDSEMRDFVGSINYYSLLNADSIDHAIIREYVFLNQDIWKNARDFFKRKSRDAGKAILLPVFSEDRQLICFAYQDEDANREIRMLRELKEVKGGGILQFSDVFPAYKCVKIHEFNELAYFLADYLSTQGILVEVEGEMWKGFLTKEEFQVLESECLHVYAEGTWEKPCNWKKNLLRSVSVEFECIDEIYEANIKSGYIRDRDEKNVMNYFSVCVEKRKLYFCGIDIRAQDTYDFLLENGIEACCFVVNEVNAGCTHRLFGKKIMALCEAVDTYKNPIFINGVSQYSAWGLGDVDYFDYIGYKRNERFILLRDYTEVPENNLLNVFRNTGAVLTGDRFLCGKLYEYLVSRGISVGGYLCTLEKDSNPENVVEVSADIIDINVVCIIVEPMCMSHIKRRFVGKEEKEQRIAYLKKKNISNYTDYFCEMLPFINIEKDNGIKYKNQCFRAKKIVLGSIMPHAGSEFFKSLLDSHPNILYIWHDGWFNDWLFWICVRLSTECAENILSLFWQMMDGDSECFVDCEAFNEKAEQLLSYDKKFTSQELFVIFHIAYMYMFRKDMPENHTDNMIIYWDPHYLSRDKLEDCVKWLGTEEVHCDILNVVRNSVQLNGSRLKRPSYIRTGVRDAYAVIASASECMPEIKEYKYSDRVIIKFEDLKCKPEEILKEICDRWGMEWSDTLMLPTTNGKEYIYYNRMQNIRGFDLGPVYNTYENFFSEFDRLRQMIIDAPWQKKYGYPYVEIDLFKRRELQEMMLKEFRFENPGDTTGLYKNRLSLDDRIGLQEKLRYRMQETRCLLSIWNKILCRDEDSNIGDVS